mgnify:CR=1 FL=1
MPQQGEDLSGRDFSGADLSGTNLVNTDLSDADLSNANLSDANLTNADLRGSDLSGADLDGADLTNAKLGDADLTDTSLSDAKMVNVSFEDDEDGLTGTVTSAVGGLTLLVGFALLAMGVSNFWLAFVIGWAVLTPLAGTLAGWYEDRTADDSSTDEQANALAALRQRYADGEIDEAEFERRVERLLETESMSDAEDAYGGPSAPDSSSAAGGSESDPELERELE